MNTVLILIVLLSSGSIGLSNVAVGIAGNVIGSLVVDEVKENLDTDKEIKDGKKSP